VSSNSTSKPFIEVSTDAINWTTDGVNLPENSTFRSVVWASHLGLFVAVASGGTNRVATSPDGYNWTMRDAAEANSWASVAYSPDLGILVAISRDGTNRAMWSTDGIRWTASSIQSLIFETVSWSPAAQCFMACSGASDLMPGAAGGENWSNDDSNVSRVWRCVVGTNIARKEFVLCAANGTGRVMIAERTDLLTFSYEVQTTTSQAWEKITYSAALGRFVMVANETASVNSIAYSDDAETWTIATQSVATGSYNDVIATG